MKCPHCGTWTEVLATRGAIRTRRCANYHRFFTEEVHRLPPPDPWVDIKKRALALVAEGRRPPAVARELGIDKSTVYRWVREADE